LKSFTYLLNRARELGEEFLFYMLEEKEKAESHEELQQGKNLWKIFQSFFSSADEVYHQFSQIYNL